MGARAVAVPRGGSRNDASDEGRSVCRVHEFHVDEALACMAPFHATAHYARLVQICKLEGSRWAFLAQMQKTGTTLPRAALVKMCAKDHVRITPRVCSLPPCWRAARAACRC